jgi:ubiquinone/menaquinone biosynthesis C-methylase UbiE
MDDVSKYNRERWNALASAHALFTRPDLKLDAISARHKLDPEGRLGELTGRRVLCLASGGGQQSVAFALLGAQVTVFDVSEEQLLRDREAAAYYQFDIETVLGDMRDLSAFADATFDIVWHPYSLNFVPDARVVFREVARVLRNHGCYHLQFANPFFSGLGPQDWNGNGYNLHIPYIDGVEITNQDQEWVYDGSKKLVETIPVAREYRQTLSTVFNGLIEHGFVILHLSDDLHMVPDLQGEPGTWDHFVAFAPPWLALWSVYAPNTFTHTS